ncbi:MAG: hypothetical protein H6814_09020 [Phycisphaeraceae bacterium]|nr:hypothetical protein [Phycisphaeraceae bacterium]
MTEDQVLKLGYDVVATAISGPVTVAEYRHHRLRVIAEEDGSESSEPFEEVRYLLCLDANRRRLWLTPEDRRRVLWALQEVGGEKPIEEFDEGRVAHSPSVKERIWVHRQVEWLVSTGRMPDQEVFNDDPIGSLRSLGLGTPDSVPLLSLLISEIRQALGRCEPPARLPEDDCGPFDPTGELEGPRPGVTRWVCRSQGPGAGTGIRKKTHPPPSGRSSDGIVLLRGIDLAAAPPAARPRPGLWRGCAARGCGAGCASPWCCCGGFAA